MLMFMINFAGTDADAGSGTDVDDGTDVNGGTDADAYLCKGAAANLLQLFVVLLHAPVAVCYKLNICNIVYCILYIVSCVG